MQVYGRYAFRLDRIVAVYIGKDIGPIFLNSLAAENTVDDESDSILSVSIISESLKYRLGRWGEGGFHMICP